MVDYARMLKAAIGDPSNGLPVPEARLDTLARRFSKELVALWRADGWCAYAGGLLWTVDPEAVTPLIADWPGLPAGAEAIARDAFADLFLLVGREVHRLDVHRDVLDFVTSDVDFFFDMKIFNPRFAADHLEGKLFKAARRRLGDLATGECYAFVPALALGGSRAVAGIRKVRMLEHIALLAQAHEA